VLGRRWADFESLVHPADVEDDLRTRAFLKAYPKQISEIIKETCDCATWW
jgi:hypothetical protein